MDIFFSKIANRKIFFLWYLSPPVGGISSIADRLNARYCNITFASGDMLQSLKIWKLVLSFILIIKHELVFIHAVSLRSLVWAIWACLLFKKIILIEHNHNIITDTKINKRIFRRLIYLISDRVFFVGYTGARVALERFPNSKIRVVSPLIPIQDSDFEPNPETHVLCLKKGKVFGVSCYKYIENSGVDFYGITDAAKIVSVNFPNSVLAIISPDAQRIREIFSRMELAGNIEVHFFSSEYPLTSWLSSFDIFFRLPLSDGFGLSVFEAIQAGCKVVATPADSRLDIPNVFVLERADHYQKNDDLIAFVEKD